MIRTYKFTHSEESKVFLTSDTHFYHSKLLENRGFKTIEEHNETLIKNWNDNVRPQDSVIHLGDFLLGVGDRGKEYCIDLFNSLNGRIWMLFGNHNSGIKTIYKECINLQYHLREDLEVYPITWNDKVTFVGNSMLAHIKYDKFECSTLPLWRKCKNYFVFCSHYAHRIFIDSHKNVTHACGHSHGSDNGSNPDNLSVKRLDVGVDNFNFTPLSFDHYLSIMEKKQIEILDHHNSKTNPSLSGKDLA